MSRAAENTSPPATDADPLRGVALVTGAARGIGAAVALRLHEEGFVVAALDVLACDPTVDRIVLDGGTAAG